MSPHDMTAVTLELGHLGNDENEQAFTVGDTN
jgi:hypothetical protein